MSKFKVGDRVRAIKSVYESEGIKKGQTGIVKAINDYTISVYPDYLNNTSSDQNWNFLPDYLDIVEETSMPTPEYSCIRVVPPSKPKREIVEGKHSLSNLAEFRIDRKYSDYTVNLSVDKGWNFGAESLREFAAVLIEIASVLEENSNA